MQNQSSTYYMYEGFPCEVRTLDEEGYGYEAFIYVAGKGLTPCNVTNVLFNGKPISEEQFKTRVVELSRRQPRGD